MKHREKVILYELDPKKSKKRKLDINNVINNEKT